MTYQEKLQLNLRYSR